MPHLETTPEQRAAWLEEPHIVDVKHANKGAILARVALEYDRRLARDVDKLLGMLAHKMRCLGPRLASPCPKCAEITETLTEQGK